MNKMCIITVNYNSYPILERFLAVHAGFFSDSLLLYIADLSSKKKDISAKGYIHVIRSDNNGYAHGVNICLKKAITDGFNQFIVMNNDVRLNNDFIEKADKSFLENPHSVIGPKIYYEKGYEYHKRRYHKDERGSVLWYAGGKIDWNHALIKHIGVDEVDRGQYDEKESTGFVSGCCMLFTKSVIDKIGMWDEKYFMYYEDGDYCVRAKKAGIPLIYDPSLILWHQNAQSTGGSGSKFHVRHQQKSRLRFGLKYAPIKTKLHLIVLNFKNQISK